MMSRPSLVGMLVVAGVVAAGAGAWCCGGSGSTPADSPGKAPARASSSASGPTAAWVDPALVGSGPAPGGSVPAASQAGASTCPTGPVLLSVRVAALGGSDPGRSTVLHEGGAFTDEADRGVARGCLGEADQAKIQAALGRADFTPPPPPEVQCMAVPTREVAVEHPPSGRRATFSSPCGKSAHPTIADLVRLVRELAESAGPDAPR